MTKKTKKAERFMVRQGDVMVVAVDSIPTGAEPVALDAGRVVLAYGEVTGHAHAFSRAASRSLSLRQDEKGLRYLDVGGGGATLRHEEHAPIEIPPGRYQVVRQREYTPEAIRQVAD